MRGEHEGQVVGGHLVGVLPLGGVVEQLQEQLEQRAVGGREQHEEQLQRLDLPLFVRHRRLVAPLIEAGHICSEGEGGGVLGGWINTILGTNYILSSTLFIPEGQLGSQAVVLYLQGNLNNTLRASLTA